MANCPTLIAIEKDGCLSNAGGLKLKAYILPSEFRTGLVYEADYTIKEVEYVDNTTPVLPVSISFHKNTATLAESMAGTAETANSTNTVTVSITVNNRQYNKSKAINILGAGQRELDLVIEQNNGTAWFVPNATLSVESATGAVRADGSNYVLTFTAELDDLVRGIKAVDVEELITTGKIEPGS